MRALGRLLGCAGPVALLAGAAGAAQAGEPPAEPRPEPLDVAFLEFLAEEAGVDEELSDALMSADLDRAIAQSRRRSEVDRDDKD